MTKESLDREKKDTHQGVVKVEDSNGDVCNQLTHLISPINVISLTKD